MCVRSWAMHRKRKAVIYNKFSLFRLQLCAVLTIGLAAVMAVPGQSDDKASREQQIADLEKQIQEANKKLADLRRTNGATTIALPVEGPLPAAWIKPLTW